LRTIPLSVSGIFIGTGLAWREGFSDTSITIWAVITTICFQITSNFANDYGDGIKGTDNQDRLGPDRAVQSGLLSAHSMKRGVLVMVGLSILSIIGVLAAAFGPENIGYIVLFALLGVFSIWAAIKYTVGADAYGYSGLGDIFVFGFFGLLSVLGSYFLYTKQLTATAWLPAAAIGFLCTAVLNLNNLRDIDNDKESGKRTLVVQLGNKWGRIYHYTLLMLALFCMLLYNMLESNRGIQLLHLIAFLPLLVHVLKIRKKDSPTSLDPELKKVALSTFAMSVLFLIGYYYFL